MIEDAENFSDDDARKVLKKLNTISETRKKELKKEQEKSAAETEKERWKQLSWKEKILETIMKHSSISYGKLLEELKIKGNLLLWHTDQLKKAGIITKSKSKNQTIFAIAPQNKFHVEVMNALTEDSSKHKSANEIKKIIRKKEEAESKSKEECMSSIAIDQILIQLEGIHHIEKCDDEGNTGSYSKETKNFFKITDEYPNRDHNDDTPSGISIKYNICPRCKNQIKPGERRLYTSMTKTHSKLHKYESQYGIDEYHGSPAETTEINCFHFECLDKSIIDTNDGRKAITCAHCFLPLSRSKLIDELNLDWNDKTLISNIDKLFSDDPLDIIWSSVNRSRYSEFLETTESLELAAWNAQEPTYNEAGQPDTMEATYFLKHTPYIFTCKEIDGKKYHPYCAKQIKKK